MKSFEKMSLFFSHLYCTLHIRKKCTEIKYILSYSYQVPELERQNVLKHHSTLSIHSKLGLLLGHDPKMLLVSDHNPKRKKQNKKQ